jgi:hypothetical protein
MQTYSMKVNAINAARKFMAAQSLSGDWSDHFVIESKGPRQYVIEHKPVLNRENAWQSLIVATEGEFKFPTAKDVRVTKAAQWLAAQAFFASRSPAPMSDEGEDEGYGDKIEDDERELARQQREADAKANDEQANAAPGSKYPAGWVHKSAVEKPVNRVWAIADEMLAANPEVTRAQVQAECVKRGIASGTARTQYQAWFSARRAALENQQRAAELSKKFNSQ